MITQPKQIIFDEEKHSYHVDNVRLTSVTTFLKQFFKPFDDKEVATKLAKMPKYKKQGITAKDLLQQWKDDRDFGTKVHAILERAIVDASSVDGITVSARVFEYVTEPLKYIKNLKNTVFKGAHFQPELRIYDEELGLAGTIDLCVTEGNVFHLTDWKTNKSIETRAYNDECAKEPLAHLPDCHYVKYAMQLFVYCRMLERMGYVFGSATIVHLKANELVTYKLKYDSKLVDSLFRVGGLL